MRPELLDHFRFGFHQLAPPPLRRRTLLFSLCPLFDNKNASTEPSGRKGILSEFSVGRIRVFPATSQFRTFHCESTKEIHRASASARGMLPASRWSSLRSAAFRRRASPCKDAAP